MSGTPGAHGGILIVDDHADLRDSLAEILVDEGYQVSCAANGQEALEHLRTCPAAGRAVTQQPDMPAGGTG